MKLEDLGITKEELTERLIEALVEELRGQLVTDLRNEIKKQISAELTMTVARVVSEQSSAAFDSVFQPVDDYGKAEGEPTTVRKMFTKRCQEWWNQKVDRNGKPTTSSYNQEGTMAEWHASQAIKEVVSKELPEQLGGLLKSARTELATAFSKQISEMVVKKFG